MQTQHALCMSSEQLSAQVKADFFCVSLMYLSAFCSSLFQILSHCGSENILEVSSASCLWWQPGKAALSFSSDGGENRLLSFNKHKVMGRSDLLPVFPQQPSCSSEDLSRRSLVVLKPVKQGWVASAGDLTTVYILKNNPNKTDSAWALVCIFRWFINLFDWMPNTDHLLWW